MRVPSFAKVEFSSHPGKYIKYHDNVLEQMLNKFFDEEVSPVDYCNPWRLLSVRMYLQA